MSPAVVLRPGRATLADWQAIYRGAPARLDPVARADVEAGAAGMAAVLTRDGPMAAENAAGSPKPAELREKSGAFLPSGLVGLLMALKLASFGQGLSGVRWEVVQSLADCLARDLLPAIPAQNADDRVALLHISGVLAGAAEIISGKRRRSAGKALKKAGLVPLTPNAEEQRALLSGSELSTAFALAGLFEAERIFQSALVAGALAAAGAGLSIAPISPRARRLSRHRGQSDVAAALRSVLGAAQTETPPLTGEALPDSIELRRFEAQMGACLDLLRQAGETLQRTANSVSEDQCVVWQTGEVVDGLDGTAASGLAADIIALALREIATVAERRIASLARHAGGGPFADGMVAGFLADIRERARPAGFATALGTEQSERGANSLARLLPVAGTTALVVAVEFLAAVAACEQRGAEHAGGKLADVRRLLRKSSPQAGSGRAVPATDLAGVAELIRSGALAAATDIALPSVLAVNDNVADLGARAKIP